MNEEQIANAISQKLKDAVNFSNSNISQKQETGLRYYKRSYLPGDDKLKGRSKFVSGELQQRVDFMTAQLIRIFDSPREVVEFIPFGPEDTALARQQTDVVNWILRVKNSHLSFLHPWIQNGLINGVGIVTAEFTSEKQESLSRLIKGVSLEQLVVFDLQEQAGEIIIEQAGKPYRNELGAELRDLKIRNIRKVQNFNVLSVPPEDFVVSKDARFSVDGLIEARLQGHRKIVSKADLIAMGYDADKVEKIPLASNKTDGVAIERTRDLQGEQGVSGDDVEVFVVYSKLNLDGKPRHYRFTLGGDVERQVLIDYEETSRFYPYAAFCPFPIADTLFGLGIPDKIGDDHLLISKMNRAVIDDLHMHVHPVRVVNPDVCNLDDLMNVHPGSVVRSSDPTGGISHNVSPFAGADAIPVIAQISQSLDFNTGVGPSMMALNASDLQNTTATAISSRNNSSQLIVELVSRVFADTGYRALVKIIVDLLIQNPDDAQAFVARLSNNYIPIDSFDPEMDAATSIGFAVMSKDQSAASLNNLLAQQMSAMQSGLNIVTPQHVYATLSKLAENQGFKDTSMFFVDPSTLPPPPPPPPAVDPNAGLIQVETAKAELKFRSDDADRQFEMQKLVAQLQQQQSEFNDQMELKTRQLEQDYLLKLMELDKKYAQQNEPRNDLSQLMIEVPNEQH